MSHSPVRLALLHPKRLLLLAAVAALLAGLAIALQPVSADSHDTPSFTISARGADGTFVITPANLEYGELNQFHAASLSGGGGVDFSTATGMAGIEFSWVDRHPSWGRRGNPAHLYESQTGEAYDANDADHTGTSVRSVPFTITFPQDADATGTARSVTATINLNLSGGADRVTRELTLTLPPTPAASVMGALRQDADGKLAPRDSTQLTIGLRIAPDFDGNPNLAANTQACVALGTSDPDGTDTPPMGACGDNQIAADAGGALLDSSSYLVITGPATFANGSKRIVPADLKCEASSAISSSLPAGNGTCYARWDADGDDSTDPVVPTISVAADAADEITVTANLVARQDSSVDGDEIFYAVLDNKDGAERNDLTAGRTQEVAQKRVWHSSTGTYYKLARSYFGQYTIGIDTVQQLSSVALSRRVNPTTRLLESGPVRINTEAIFNLALRNANGQASSIGAVSAITVTAVGGGTITSEYCPSDNLSSCTVNLTTTVPTGRKSVRVDSTTGNMPGLLGAIPFTFNAPAKPGTSTIRATVIGTTAGNFQESLTIIVSGSATAITLGAGVPSILAYDTPDAAVADDPATTTVDETVAKDDRDTVSIPVSATDANGNPAKMPEDATVRVTGPGGAALPSGSHSAQVKCTNTERTRCGVVIDVEAAAATPLPSGLYKATVSGSGVDQIEASFNVAGNPASVSISVPEKSELGAVGESFTATATVTDADGTPVADGEAIEFSSQATAGGVLTARVVSPSEVGGTRTGRTRNGQVAAQVTIVGRGVSVLTATAPADSAASRTAKSGTAVINTEASAIPVSGDAGPVIRYLTPDGQPGTGPADYLGAAQSTATAILAMNEAATAVWLFNGTRWIRYAEDADGEAIPGSIPFSVLPGDILWFGG